MRYRNPSLVCPNLRSGDLIGFAGADITSDFINLVTYGIPRWSVSHVAIAAEYNESLVLFESTFGQVTPCLVAGILVNGTQVQDIDVRINATPGRIYHYPLERPLRAWERRSLSAFLLRGVGKPYDRIGAIRAGAKVWAWLQGFLHDESIASLFCSDWVAAAHRHIERFDTRNVGIWSPNALVREQRRRGILGTPRRIK